MRKLAGMGKGGLGSPVGLFTKAAELGAFAGVGLGAMSVARVTLAKANSGGRAETCRDSIAAQAGCCLKTVSRALKFWSERGFCRVIKTLCGLVVIWDVSALSRLARIVDDVRAHGRELVLTVKDMRARFAQAVDMLRKGHGVQSSGHGVPRSLGEPLVKEGGEGASSAAGDIAAYLALCAQRQRARGV